MNDKKEKPRKIRRRRTTGRVSGTSQSAFATNSMSSILKQQAEEQARKKEEPKEEASKRKGDEND